MMAAKMQHKGALPRAYRTQRTLHLGFHQAADEVNIVSEPPHALVAASGAPRGAAAYRSKFSDPSGSHSEWHVVLT